MKRLALVLLLGSALAGPAAAVVTSTPVGNVSYTALSTDQRLLFTVAFTAPRTITLPSAGASCIGQTCPAAALELIDQVGVVTNTNTLTITPASGETINNSTSSITISEPFGRILLIPTNGSNWHLVLYAPGQYPGTTSADNAPAGSIGEFISAVVTSTGGGVSLTNATAANVAQVLLTSGDWDCRGNVLFNQTPNSAVTSAAAWTSTGSAAAPLWGGTTNGSENILQMASINGPRWQMLAGTARYSLAAATSVYLEGLSYFTTGTASAQGFLGCRRTR